MLWSWQTVTQGRVVVVVVVVEGDDIVRETKGKWSGAAGMMGFRFRSWRNSPLGAKLVSLQQHGHGRK